MVFPDTTRADRLEHGIDAKYQESSLIPVTSIGLRFKEICIDEQVPLVIAGQYVFEGCLIGYRRAEKSNYAESCPGTIGPISFEVIGPCLPES
jgi:hypothetical protein